MTNPKPEELTLKPSFHQARELDDRLLRLIGIPFFGLAIPNFTGLFGPIGPVQVVYWIGYLYFIGIAFSIWQGNRWLLFQQRKYHNWFDNPLRKLLNLVAANVFYTAPLTILLLLGWYWMAGLLPDWQTIRVCALVNVICVLFVTHVYETVFLIKERQSDALEYAQLERARIQAELEALKSQIDPHFLFNSLNTLSFLIEQDSRRASLFTDKLADVYRYILFHKDKPLVGLLDELEFLRNYLILLRLRFGDSIHIQEPDLREAGFYLIVPISLQVLLENAVKHNEFDEQAPLYIDIALGSESVSMTNNRRPRRSLRPGAGLGLQNLSERSRLLTGRDIVVESTAQQFRVETPVLKTVI